MSYRSEVLVKLNFVSDIFLRILLKLKVNYCVSISNIYEKLIQGTPLDVLHLILNQKVKCLLN